MTRHVVVTFEGESSGIGDLTWSQYEIWPIMQRQRSSFSVGGVLPLPRGSTVQSVAADLSFVMSRHASLRTRLGFTADGQPQQVVARSGEALLEVVEAGENEPAEIAATVHRRYDERIFDCTREWPIRWAVIVSRGTATHLVSVISHFATDGMGAMAMLDDLASRDPVTGGAKGAVNAITQLELARLQGTPQVLRQNDAALRYWEGLLRLIPAQRFPGLAVSCEPRYWQAHFDSPASFLAVQPLAARTGVSTSTVLLAAYAIALARVTGVSPSVIQVVVHNRYRRGFVGMVAHLANAGLCMIDVADISCDEAVARVWRSTVRAYKNAYCDPRKRAELIARVGKERGEEINLQCYFNDRRLGSAKEPEGRLPRPADVRATLPRSELTWGQEDDNPGQGCYLHVSNVPNTVHWDLLADTHYASPADMEAILRNMEAVITEAAFDPAAPTGVLTPERLDRLGPAPPRGKDARPASRQPDRPAVPEARRSAGVSHRPVGTSRAVPKI